MVKIKLQFNIKSQCTDDDNRSYRNVCNMSFVSFSLAVIFIIRLFSTSTFHVPNCMLITKKHVSTESFVINVNSNHIERTLTGKYLGVIVDKKLTWKDHCKQLCCTISKYVGVMYKVKHYVNNQGLRMLYHSLINSRAQYGIIAWGRTASCHAQPILVVLNYATRCLNPNKLLTNEVTTIYKTQKFSNQKIYTILK